MAAMDKLFGIPMDGLALTLAAILAVLLVPVLWTLLFNRIMFRIGLRNIPRRKAQSALIVLGLMLSTLIMTSAFGFGDSLNYSIKSDIYRELGPIDETITVKGQDEESGGLALFPESDYVGLAVQVAGEPAIETLVPALEAPAAVRAGDRNAPGAALMGLPTDQEMQELRAANGTALPDLDENEVLVNEALAEELELASGDTVEVFAGPQPLEITVAGVVPDGGLAGTEPRMLAPLEAVQELTGAGDRLSAIFVSNRGDAEAGVEETGAAVEALEAATAGTGLSVEATKQDGLSGAEEVANAFTSIFMILGLFSVMVGVLLIFLIFVMLAAERKPEMGISRAVGTKRRHLIQSFLSEGALYSLLAAAVGAGLGVLVSWLLIGTVGRIFATLEPGWTFSFDITPWSLIAGYSLGMIITFTTVLFSSWRVSRLNIVAAIRDVPEPENRRLRGRSTVIALLALVGGAALSAVAWQQIWGSAFWLGTSAVIVAAAVLVRRFVASERVAYSLAGGGLLAWWFGSFWLDDRVERIYELSGGFEMFFLSGVMLVAGAVWLVMYNAQSVLSLATVIFRRSRSLAPVIKTATSYPLAYPFRTGLTLGMFALIVFSLVMMSVISESFSGDEEAIREYAGGYMVQGSANPNNPPQNLEAAISEDPELRDRVAGFATVSTAPAEVREAGGESEFAEATLQGVDEDFLRENEFPIKVRAEGYENDREVWEALRDDPNLAVVSAMNVRMENAFIVGDTGFQLKSVSYEQDTMRPTEITARNPQTGEETQYTVIGVLDFARTFDIYTSEAGLERYAGMAVPPNQYLFRLKSGAEEVATARELESAFVTNGLQASSMTAEFEEQNSTNDTFNTLLQAFMGLGLLVGIAALGVISIRSVVERRQQIGMLRAIGFKRRMVQAAFMIEYSFIAVVGIAIGLVLGISLAYLLLTDDQIAGTGAAFSLPVTQLAVIVGIAYLAALVATYWPARRAANIPVAEALRYE
ncbi:FtsX-like permease family protein [Rubrobacter taiwanensis]|uniref:FtsX-like permease family protein n=2 Tax=Rubrobacter taiwanensis TaxID=185139 RepID=A0A4R1BL47_9ACTN|nr:FtsX-like permease family protein [Rubrobacter taiwanensis]